MMLPAWKNQAHQKLITTITLAPMPRNPTTENERTAALTEVSQDGSCPLHLPKPAITAMRVVLTLPTTDHPSAEHIQLVGIIKGLTTDGANCPFWQIAKDPTVSKDPTEVAMIYRGSERAVRLSLHPDVKPDQAIIKAIRAYKRAVKVGSGHFLQLIVMPQLNVDKPIVLPPRVAIASMDAAIIRAALSALSTF